MDCTMSTPALLGAARAMSRLGVCRWRTSCASCCSMTSSPRAATGSRASRSRWTTSVRMFNEIDLKLRRPCSDIGSLAQTRVEGNSLQSPPPALSPAAVQFLGFLGTARERCAWRLGLLHRLLLRPRHRLRSQFDQVYVPPGAT